MSLAALMAVDPPARQPSPVVEALEPTFELPSVEGSAWWRLAQRAFAAIGLLLFAPFVPLIWLSVRATSKGPFLFRQQRRGRGNSTFTIYKIRTLTTNAEAQTQLGVGQGDTRITAVGSLLRRLKIDEVPQLWNVARGDMELVGPRPIPIALDDELRSKIPGFGERSRVRPGLTSIAQIAVIDNGLGASLIDDWHQRFQAERHYLRRKSFGYDLVVLGLSAAYLLWSFVSMVRRARRAAQPDGTGSAEVLGIPIDAIDRTSLVRQIESWVECEESRAVAFCPARSIVESVRTPAHRDALLKVDAAVAEDRAVVFAQSILTRSRSHHRVRARDVALDVLSHAAANGWRVAFCGDDAERVARARNRSIEKFPGLQVVAALEANATARIRLAAARPDLVLVGLKSPAQELWLAEHRREIPGVLLGVNTAFDTLEGRRTPRARWFSARSLFAVMFGCQLARQLIRARSKAPLASGRGLPPDPGPAPAVEPLAVTVIARHGPEHLRVLLRSLAETKLPEGVQRLQVRIVDTDSARRAERVVFAFESMQLKDVDVLYDVETTGNAAAARNRALAMGPVHRMAFVDDHATVDAFWLHNAWNALESGRVDAVFGRTMPSFVDGAPGWLLRGRFLERDAGPAGVDIDWTAAQSSNALVDARWFHEQGLQFRESFGRHNADDTELFRRMMMSGARFRSAPDAVVRETVEDRRCRFRNLFANYWRGGANFEHLMRDDCGTLHALLRLAKRATVGTVATIASVPALIGGRPEGIYGSLLYMARAAGGVAGRFRARFDRSGGAS